MTDVSQAVDYFRKQAKKLLRDFKAGLGDADARAKAILSDTREFSLMSSQHVIAVECGFGTWADLLRTTPIRLYFEITMHKHPTLNSSGFGLYSEGAMNDKERADALRRGRLALRENYDRVVDILEWLKENLIAPSEDIWKGGISYDMRHDVEEDIDYITNGELIIAFIIAGFDFEVFGVNAYFGISEESWRAAVERNRYLKLIPVSERIEAPDIGKFNVRASQCRNCLFGSNPLVDQARKEEIIRGCLETDTHFVCHEFKNACCNGFWHEHARDVVPTRIALALDAVEFVGKPHKS